MASKRKLKAEIDELRARLDMLESRVLTLEMRPQEVVDPYPFVGKPYWRWMPSSPFTTDAEHGS